MIECSHLSYNYERDVPILTDVSFQVKQGEFVAIFGPNGGGKTTLLKLLIGFLSPKKGTIKVEGKPPIEMRAHIAYVPQSHQYDRAFPISVDEVVLGGRQSMLPWYGRYSTEDRLAAKKAITSVGLKGFENASFGTLSGGQAQRALIARAIVSQPKILFLDEPTASVDQQAEIEILSLLEKLKGTTTIVMVTHQLKTATEYADSMLCVQKQVVALNPEQVCDHFSLGLYHPLFSQDT